MVQDALKYWHLIRPPKFRRKSCRGAGEFNLSIKEKRKLSIGIIISGSTHYSPGVKPFVWIAKWLDSLGFDFTLFRFKCGEEVNSFIKEKFSPIHVIDCSSEMNLIRNIQRSSVGVVFSDDAFDRIRILDRIKKELGLKTAVYVHIFFGLLTLSPSSYSQAIRVGNHRLRLFRLIPFSLLSSSHRRMLSSADIVISNSQFTEMLTSLLYGRKSSGVIYPPINDDAFPAGNRDLDREGVLVFVGDKLDRDPASYIPTLKQILEKGVRIKLFGDNHIMNYIFQKLKSPLVSVNANLTDTELFALYRTSKITYITQNWEDFGNVGPESLLNGTPVIVETPQPWMELTGQSPLIRIERNSNNLADRIIEPIPFIKEEQDRLLVSLTRSLSPRAATENFLKIVQDLTE